MSTNDDQLFSARIVDANEEKVGFEESEKERLRAELARLEKERLQQIREWVTQDYKHFIGFLCKLTLDILDEDTDGFSDEKLSSLRKHYSDMAETYLHSLSGEKISPSRDGYISLIDWVRNHADQPHRLLPQNIESSKIESIAMGFFLDQEYDFGILLHWVFELVYHGVPIYTFDSELNTYEMVAADSADSLFMLRLGKEYMDVRTGMFPEWIKGYYFLQSDLEAHSIFFRGELPEEKGIDALRYAYRRYLSPSLVGEGSENGDTKSINSAGHGRLIKAIAEFPGEYPHYKARPPKLDNDVRPWMASQGFATTDAEKRVFGAILAEHFKLSPDSKN